MFPFDVTINIPDIFGTETRIITVNSGLTVLIGPNGTGKTRVLRELRRAFEMAPTAINLRQHFTEHGKNWNGLVRYITSNRIAGMEIYRSQDSQHRNPPDNYNCGGTELKQTKNSLETARGDFYVLDARRDIFIKVSERLSKLFKRELFLSWESGHLKLHIKKDGSDKQYSVVNEASGLINVVSLLTALYNDEVKVILIDEPEVSLHPQLQSFLLEEIKKVCGDPSEKGKKLVIMSTHSAEMIDIRDYKDITNYVFFSEGGKIHQVSANTEELRNNKLQDFIVRLGHDCKSAFFAETAILVEGITDAMLCKFFDSRCDLNLGVAGAHIVQVNGKGQFATIAKLFKLIGKKSVIIADLDAFIDDDTVTSLIATNECVNASAQRYAHPDIATPTRKIKHDIDNFGKDLERHIPQLIKENIYFLNKEPHKPELFHIKRAFLSLLFSEGDAILTQLCEDTEKLRQFKTQINTLFDIFETGGFFFLRRGTIESYYLHDKVISFEKKPRQANEEIHYISENEGVFIERYDDILRALKYAAQTVNIDESSRVKDELSSEVAVIFNHFTEELDDVIIKSLIKKTGKQTESLFNYSINESKTVLEVTLNSDILNIASFPLQIEFSSNPTEIIHNYFRK